MLLRYKILAPAAALLAGVGLTTAIAASSTTSDPSAGCSTPTPDGAGNYGSTCTFSIPQATGPTTTETVPGPTTTVSGPTTTVPGPTTTVTVTATPTPTTTTPPPPPPFPDASDTGTPAGVILHSCSTTAFTAGATYDACEFNGSISPTVAITITRSKIDGAVGYPDADLHGLKISDTTVDCHCPSTNNNSTPTGIAGSNFTLIRVNEFDSGHGIAPQSNVDIENSFVHNLGGNTGAHKDGFYVGEGTNVTVRDSNIECNDGSAGGCTSAIGLLSDFGTITNWTIDHNLLNTNGSYCFYGGGGPQKPYTPNHITFINNHFGRKDNPQCGHYGPVTYFDSSAAGNVWSGNVWDDTGATVPPMN